MNLLFNETSLLDELTLQNNHVVNSIIAIDEVGRGCVAGPVLTCATLWVRNPEPPPQARIPAWLSLIKDSKKLSPKKRQQCFEQVLAHFNLCPSELPIQSPAHRPELTLYNPRSVLAYENLTDSTAQSPASLECVGFCLGEGSVAEVEQFNIWNAVQIAAARALFGLEAQFSARFALDSRSCIILMDGNKSLRVPQSFSSHLQVTAVKGDDIFVSIGCSSILAKVYRDTLMEEHCHAYPQFGFSQHKGYGTAVHLANIQKFGPSPLHRLSFLKNYLP